MTLKVAVAWLFAGDLTVFNLSPLLKALGMLSVPEKELPRAAPNFDPYRKVHRDATLADPLPGQLVALRPGPARWNIQTCPLKLLPIPVGGSTLGGPRGNEEVSRTED